MNFQFLVTHKINGKSFNIKEPSFYDYKSLVKSLIDNDNKNILKTFDMFLHHCCGDVSQENNVTKFLLLLKIRELILGGNIELNAGDAKINFPIQKVFDSFNSVLHNYIFQHDGVNYEFCIPRKLLPDDNIAEVICDCLYGVNGTLLSTDIDINQLPALPLAEIYTGIAKFYLNVKFTIPVIDFTLLPFNDSFITFLYLIFSFDLKQLYNIEYTLRRSLNLNSMDLYSLSYPECDILIKTLREEVAEAEKNSQKVENQITMSN